MKQNRLFKFLIVAFVTVVIVAYKWQPREPDLLSQAEVQAVVSRFLVKNGFAITLAAEDQVSGARDTCEVLIKQLVAQGWNESQMKVMAKGRRLLFVTGGRVFEDHQPIWRTWAQLQARRFLSKIGIDMPKVIVFGVAISPACQDTPVDWRGLTSPSTFVVDMFHF